jgi:hypothetical protein
MELEPFEKTIELVLPLVGEEALFDIVIELEGTFPPTAEVDFVDTVAEPAVADLVVAGFGVFGELETPTEPDAEPLLQLAVEVVALWDELVELPDGRVLFPIPGPHDPVIIICALTPPVVPLLVTSISSQKSGRRIC